MLQKLKCHICEEENDWGMWIENQRINKFYWFCLGCIYKEGAKDDWARKRPVI